MWCIIPDGHVSEDSRFASSNPWHFQLYTTSLTSKCDWFLACNRNWLLKAEWSLCICGQPHFLKLRAGKLALTLVEFRSNLFEAVA